MRNVFYLLLGALILIGCSGVKVISDLDKTVDFTSFKTFEYYGWMEGSDKLLNDFDKKRLEEAFGEEFRSRGLELVEEGGDLIVALFIHTEQKTQTTANTYSSGGGYGYGYGGYYGYGPNYGWGGSGHSTTTYDEYDYEEGTLVCDIFDTSSEKLIWEGIGTGTINEDPQKRERTIPAAVKQIMSEYPVKPISKK